MLTRRGSHATMASSAVLRFLAIFLVVTATVVAVWPWVAPAYTRLVTIGVRLGLQLVESPQASVLEVRGDELWVYRIVGAGQIRPFTWFDRYTFFALIPLFALFLATPGMRLVERAWRTGIALLGLLLIQAVYLVSSIQMAYVAVGLAEPGAFLARSLNGWQVMLRVLWEAAPLALWAALTAKAWARMLRGARELPQQHSTRRTAGQAGSLPVVREGRAS